MKFQLFGSFIDFALVFYTIWTPFFPVLLEITTSILFCPPIITLKSSLSVLRLTTPLKKGQSPLASLPCSPETVGGREERGLGSQPHSSSAVVELVQGSGVGSGNILRMEFMLGSSHRLDVWEHSVRVGWENGLWERGILYCYCYWERGHSRWSPLVYSLYMSGFSLESPVYAVGLYHVHWLSFLLSGPAEQLVGWGLKTYSASSRYLRKLTWMKVFFH